MNESWKKIDIGLFVSYYEIILERDTHDMLCAMVTIVYT